MDLAMVPWSFESINYCASIYVKAFLDLMIVLQYLVLMMLAFTSIYQMVENASRSTFDRREHRFSVNSLGNMSVRLSTR